MSLLEMLDTVEGGIFLLRKGRYCCRSGSAPWEVTRGNLVDAMHGVARGCGWKHRIDDLWAWVWHAGFTEVLVVTQWDMAEGKGGERPKNMGQSRFVGCDGIERREMNLCAAIAAGLKWFCGAWWRLQTG